MNLHTSRYQNGEVISTSGLVPLGHTRSTPRFALAYPLAGNIRPLAPKQTAGDWRGAYRAQLDRLGFEVARSYIHTASGGADAVLLCYEHLGIQGEESCHRRIFAEWWESQSGEPVPELDDRGPISQKLQAIERRRNRSQGGLFP